jgi:hypothetical protein
MKTAHLFAIILCLVALTACGKKKVMTVRWDGGNRMEDINWTVDKQPVGKGVEGFQCFLSRLDELPDSSYLKVNYPAALWNRHVPGYFVMDVFPFRENDALRKQFEAIAIKRHVVFETFPEYE